MGEVTKRTTVIEQKQPVVIKNWSRADRTFIVIV